MLRIKILILVTSRALSVSFHMAQWTEAVKRCQGEQKLKQHEIQKGEKKKIQFLPHEKLK